MLTFTFTLMASYVSLFLGATAAPLEPRDVVAPPITYPTEGSIWTVGSHEKVLWDTSELPPVQNITNKVGKVILGYLDDPNDPYSEHLDLDHPLATGFPITQGTIDIIVPAVEPKDNYIIVLFGDSGNISPRFSIRLAIGGTSSSSASMSSTVTRAQSSSTASIVTTTTAGTASATPNTETLPVTVTTVVQTSTTFIPSTSSTPSATAVSGLSTTISVSTVSTSSTRPTTASSSPSTSASSPAAQTTPSGGERNIHSAGTTTMVLGVLAVLILAS